MKKESDRERKRYIERREKGKKERGKREIKK